MKKLLTLTVLFMLALSANAENRKWDFTHWSSATVDNLKAGGDWSDIEKATGTEPTDLSRDNCFWEVTASGSADGTELAANGTPIAELQGLLYTNTTSRSLAIAVNYQNSNATDAAFRDYNGPSYLWLGSKQKNYFVIPSVKPGAIIKMGVESHKQTDARGVNLYIGKGSSGTQLKSPTGEDVSAPKTYEEQEWLVPTDATDAANEDGTYDIQILNTNGCHLYFIEVSEDAPTVDGSKIAYVFNSGYPGYDASNDAFSDIIPNNDRFVNITFDALDISEEANRKSLAELKAYDVVVVSGAIAAGDAYAETLRQAIAYVPMLNLNTNLYATWGYGTAETVETPSLNVPEDERDNSLFKPYSDADQYINDAGELLFFAEGSVTGVKIPENSYFANDNVLATVGSATAIHRHNTGRNAYMLIPYGAENQNYEVSINDILTNAITELNYSKSEILPAATPTFTEDYKQMNTDVTIACSTKGAKIYYTTDGSTPTDASTPYTGAINIADANVTITAVAYADGFDPSESGSLAVSLYTTSNVPEISTAMEEGKTTVTITNKEEGATLYYNFTGSKVITESSVYTDAIELTHPATITAFAGEVADKKQSETVSLDVTVTGVTARTNIISHFDANATDWAQGESKTKYYTEGKKSGYAFYVLTDSAVVTGSEGQDSTVYTAVPANNVTCVNPGKGWEAKTYGQGMLWERITISNDISDANTDARYRAETAFDQGASDNSVSFGNVQKSNKTSNDPYSCTIQSTEAFQGPFDIVTYVGNASSSNLPKAALFVSTDTTSEDNWVEVDSVRFSPKQRYVKKNIASYNGTDKVFVKLQAAFSSIMMFDIYVMNNTEDTGISDITKGEEPNGDVVRTMVYSINGARIDKAAKGINIIREVYSNGAVKTRKVVVR